ncbi:ligand-binding sensor domain-containing protein [Ferruginibacter sp.]
MKRSLILIAFLLYTSIVFSQNNAAVLYSITEKDGLTDNIANCFFQDSRGVMWIGTSYGLNSFDGSVITNFHHSSDTNTVADDVINDIIQDEKGVLWIATAGGLSAYDIAEKKFSSYSYNKTSSVLNRYYSITLVGNIILLGTEEGLFEFDRATKKFSLHQPENKDTRWITKIYRDSKQQIWLATYNGLWQYDMQHKTFTCFDSPANDAFFDGLVTTIAEDHSGQLWFGSWNKGLKKLHTDGRIESFLDFKNSNGNITSLAEQKKPDGSYCLWQTSNLSWPDTAARSFISLYNNNKPVSGNRIYCDSKNLLWISTNEGIKIYNPAKQYFQTTILSSYVPITSQGTAVFPLKNNFLVGGEGGTSLLLFSDSVKLLKNLSSQVTNGAAIMNIQQDKDGTFWMCTSNGLYLFDSLLHKKQMFLHNDKDSNSLPKNFLNYTLLKKDGSKWLLPWRKGVWRADAVHKKFFRVLTPAGDTLLPGNNLSKALEDNYGNVWITDYTGGLHKYDPVKGALKNIIESRRFTNEYILGDKLWTLSSTQVFAVDIKTDQVETYNLPEGKNKYEYDFIPDDKGWLWIATKTGLLAFNMQTKQFKSFNEDDGLYDNNLDITFGKLYNGNILMVAGSYAIAFSPSIVQQNIVSAALLFTGAAAEGAPKKISSDVIDISWGEKNIELNWALLNYSNPLGNTYYYKLDGINSNWQTAGNKGQAIYNSLEPGTYYFHFKAALSEGAMSEEKTVRIVVHPPFWKTWWFIIMTALLTAILFYAVVKYVSQRNLKEKLLQLEKQQAVEKERNRISRDMHDDLGSGLTKIAILSEVIKTQPSSAVGNIDKISETARTLVDNLDEMVWALNPRNDSLDKLVAYIAEYMHQFLESTPIVPFIALPDDIHPHHIGEEKRRNIFMAIKEFLNNSVKHSGAKTISFQLLQHANSFEMILKDDGRGIDKAMLNDLGNGLQNMQHRIEDIGGKASIESSAAGTSFVIVCPV